MTRWSSILSILVAALAFPAFAHDTLALKGGDRLTGTLLEIAEGALVFRTALAGLMVVPLDEVDWVTTESYHTIELAGGPTLAARLVRKEGKIRALPSDGAPAVPIDFAAITRTTPIRFQSPTEDLTAEELGERGLTGAVEAGILRRWATRQYTDAYTRLTLRYEGDRYHFYSNALLELSDEETFPRLVNVLAEWRLRPEQALHPEIILGLERDTDRALALRADLGAGFARSLAPGQRHELQLSAGLDVAFEHYDLELLWREGGDSLPDRLRTLQGHLLIEDLLREGPAGLGSHFRRLAQFVYYDEEVRRREKQELNLYFRLRHTSPLFRTATFSKELFLYPSLSDFGDLRARSNAGLQVPFTKNLSLRLDLTVDYEDAPEFHDVDRWSAAVGAGLTWGF